MQTTLDFLKILRIKRWYINGFVLVGGLLAGWVHGISSAHFIWDVIFATFLTCILSSANYVINEILDIKTDRHHPEKRNRSLASGRISKFSAILLAVGLYAIVILGLMLSGWPTSSWFFLALFVGAILYNVPPFRLKDVSFVDFALESVNHPIRLSIGWFSVTTLALPASIFIALWAFAALLMSAKRFAELRFITNKEQAALYRKSFKNYTERSLLLAMSACANMFMFMFGALTIRYAKNLLFILPLFVIFIVWFFYISYQKRSFINEPENIFSNKFFLLYITFMLALSFIAASYPPIVNY